MQRLLVTLFSFLLFISAINASPSLLPSPTTLEKRQNQPFFPDQPASCPICAKDYSSINSCANAAPVLANFSMIIFNPGAFIDVIMCACGDTFQSAFPQCVDCFIKTNQQPLLTPTQDLPGIVDGMRKICALKSTLLGNVSGANGYPSATPSLSSAMSTSEKLLFDRGVLWGLSVSVLISTAGVILGLRL